MRDNRLIIIISSSALFVIAVLLILFFIFGKSNNLDNKKRENILKLIERYFTQEEYDRALELIDKLLIENGDDTDVLKLQDKIIRVKKDKKIALEDAKNQRENEERQRLLDSMNNINANLKTEKPVIIRKSEANSTEDDNLNKEEKKKKEQLNKLIDEGIGEYNTQNWAKAKSKFLEALSLDDEHPEANTFLAATLFEENPNDDKNIDEAIKRIKKILKKDNTIELSHYTLAKIYDKKGASDFAVEEYKETLKINPRNYDAFNALGKIYYKNKEYEKALIQFNSAVNIKQDFVNGYFNIAMTEQKLNKKQNSINNFKRAISLDPNYLAAHANLGMLYYVDNDFKNALDAFVNVVKIDNRYNYQRKIGDCYKGLNQPDKAIDAYLTSISINPKSNEKEKNEASDTYSEMADIENKRGKYSIALDYVKKGLELSDKLPNLYFMSGYAKARLNDKSGAIDDYKKLLDLDPNYISGYVNLSNLLNEMALFDDSVKISQKGIGYDPNNYKLYNNLGDSLQKLGNYKDAIMSYKNSISKNPNIAETYFNLGICYKLASDNENSIEPFKNAIKINPNYFDAYYEIGESLFLLKMYDESMVMFNSLLDKKPDYSKKDQIKTMATVMGK